MYESVQPKTTAPKTPTPVGFDPDQIVCLENQGCRLYAEVVQTVESKRVCWVRPLMLIEEKPESCANTLLPEELPEEWPDELRVHDLRLGSDLLLPAIFFRAALDTEVMPLLMQLKELAPDAGSNPRSHYNQQIQLFVQQICRAHPEAFPARSS